MPLPLFWYGRSPAESMTGMDTRHWLYPRYSNGRRFVVADLRHITGTMLLSALCYGLGFGAMRPSIQTWMIQEVHPLRMANGMFFNSLDFGVAIGSIALGSIAKSTSYAIMYRYSAIALVILILIYIIMQVTGKSRSKATLQLEDTEPTARITEIARSLEKATAYELRKRPGMDQETKWTMGVPPCHYALCPYQI